MDVGPSIQAGHRPPGTAELRSSPGLPGSRKLPASRELPELSRPA